MANVDSIHKQFGLCIRKSLEQENKDFISQYIFRTRGNCRRMCISPKVTNFIILGGAIMAQEQKDRYLTLFVKEDDSCLASVGENGLFSSKKEAHKWAELCILEQIREETGVFYGSMDEVLEAA